MEKLKYILRDFKWVKALFSPFKPFTVKFYLGKIEIGVPYFLPRKWVKATHKLATEATLKQIKDNERFNVLNPQYPMHIKSFEELYAEKMRCSYPIPLKIGFNYCSLGWKTKFDDIRFEYAPVFSFVFFGYQLAMMIGTGKQDWISNYWEAWICYEYYSDKTQTKKERIAFCKERCPQTWVRYHKDKTKTTTDYYELILKKKYL